MIKETITVIAEILAHSIEKAEISVTPPVLASADKETIWEVA